MTVIISGPGGHGRATTAAEARAQVRRQHEKRDAAIEGARRACIAEYAELGMQIIRERTKVGADYRRASFGPYSEAYAREKGVSPTSVDLTDTGGFLADLFWEQSADGRRAVITFRGLRMRKRARGLARGRWPIYGEWTRMQRPERRIMGFGSEVDKRRLVDAGWKTFRTVMWRGLQYR